MILAARATHFVRGSEAPFGAARRSSVRVWRLSFRATLSERSEPKGSRGIPPWPLPSGRSIKNPRRAPSTRPFAAARGDSNRHTLNTSLRAAMAQPSGSDLSITASFDTFYSGAFLARFWGGFGVPAAPARGEERISRKPEMVRWASSNWHFFAVFCRNWPVLAGFGSVFVRGCRRGGEAPFFRRNFSAPVACRLLCVLVGRPET